MRWSWHLVQYILYIWSTPTVPVHSSAGPHLMLSFFPPFSHTPFGCRVCTVHLQRRSSAMDAMHPKNIGRNGCRWHSVNCVWGQMDTDANVLSHDLYCSINRVRWRRRRQREPSKQSTQRANRVYRTPSRSLLL